MRFTISVIVFVILILTFGNAEVIQSQEVTNVPIQFLTPYAFKCGENVPWTRLTGWRGISGKCRNGLLYTVVGEVDAVKEGHIKAKIVVPEDNNTEWAPFNGEVQEISNKRFEIRFCITTKSSTRPIWFQAYSKDGKKVGGKCTVTLVGVQLED
ncbi:MAG: hypothetical protein FD156_3 [Nitrospirae bacterium]|nr:MAG: hypothetical protein FD156_3 [Nitrospirota bacterium]